VGKMQQQRQQQQEKEQEQHQAKLNKRLNGRSISSSISSWTSSSLSPSSSITSSNLNIYEPIALPIRNKHNSSINNHYDIIDDYLMAKKQHKQQQTQHISSDPVSCNFYSLRKILTPEKKKLKKPESTKSLSYSSYNLNHFSTKLNLNNNKTNENRMTNFLKNFLSKIQKKFSSSEINLNSSRVKCDKSTQTIQQEHADLHSSNIKIIYVPKIVNKLVSSRANDVEDDILCDLEVASYFDRKSPCKQRQLQPQTQLQSQQSTTVHSNFSTLKKYHQHYEDEDFSQYDDIDTWSSTMNTIRYKNYPVRIVNKRNYDMGTLW
jgi:hypothetical protein